MTRLFSELGRLVAVPGKNRVQKAASRHIVLDGPAEGTKKHQRQDIGYSTVATAKGGRAVVREHLGRSICARSSRATMQFGERLPGGHRTILLKKAYIC